MVVCICSHARNLFLFLESISRGFFRQCLVLEPNIGLLSGGCRARSSIVREQKSNQAPGPPHVGQHEIAPPSPWSCDGLHRTLRSSFLSTLPLRWPEEASSLASRNCSSTASVVMEMMAVLVQSRGYTSSADITPT